MSDIVKVRSTIDGILSENDDKYDAAIKASQELADLSLKQHGLYLDLRKALIMQKWQPDVFKHGPCSLVFVGPPRAPIKTWHAELKLGNGEVRKFELKEVPEELLSDDIKKALKSPRKFMSGEPISQSYSRPAKP